MPPYYGMVKCIDDNVGRIIEALRKRELLDRTIIVFTSDHGDLCGEHGRLNKGVPYEGSARIPFLIRRALGQDSRRNAHRRGAVLHRLSAHRDDHARRPPSQHSGRRPGRLAACWPERLRTGTTSPSFAARPESKPWLAAVSAQVQAGGQRQRRAVAVRHSERDPQELQQPGGATRTSRPIVQRRWRRSWRPYTRQHQDSVRAGA